MPQFRCAAGAWHGLVRVTMRLLSFDMAPPADR
jgi:hypothetical protein